MVVLVGVSTAVRRHQGSGDSYKGKRLDGAGLQFQRFHPLSSWREAWQHAGRHGAGEGAESPISDPQEAGVGHTRPTLSM